MKAKELYDLCKPLLNEYAGDEQFEAILQCIQKLSELEKEGTNAQKQELVMYLTICDFLAKFKQSATAHDKLKEFDSLIQGCINRQSLTPTE